MGTEHLGPVKPTYEKIAELKSTLSLLKGRVVELENILQEIVDADDAAIGELRTLGVEPLKLKETVALTERAHQVLTRFSPAKVSAS